ncbi:MAG TPA: phosphate ABC transporter substrate-binding/OmpA family protein [Ideonella sp.]|nr:phosphate ABC transporter substrate-binding/OmpA family protein [Ideonella sp.]
MATLTPLAKGLLTIAIVGVAAAVAWNFGLKEMIDSRLPGLTGGPSTATSGQSSQGGQSGGTAATPAGGGAAPATPSGKAGSGPLGSPGNPLKVSIVSFHGYAPGLLANGKSLATEAGSIYAKAGVNVEFVIQDDIPTLATIFEAKTAQCAWRTSDFWAQEQPNLRNAGHDARAVMIVDNTQGADAIISRTPDIKRVEDLADKRVALLQFTPSHGMLIDAIENSSLTARKKSSIKQIYINAEEGTAGVRAALESGNVDAAVLWDPDLSLALKKVPGSTVVYSTKTASNLIYDVMVCDSRVLNAPADQAAIGAFVSGWMQGVTAARAAPDEAVDALIRTEKFFKLLADEQGKPFIKGLFANLVWTGLEDNARILGLAGGTNHYERVYARFDGIYRAAGALANPKSPVIAPQDSFDYRFINTLLTKDAPAKQAATVPEFKFTEEQRTEAVAKGAALTKPVTVSFASGSAELNKRAQKTLDDELAPFIESNGSAYFEISGNTDSVGSRDTNMRLSRARAEAVVAYLVKQWEFAPARFKIVGNGPDKPLCVEANAAAEDMTVEQCRAMNRSTRAAVLR